MKGLGICYVLVRYSMNDTGDTVVSTKMHKEVGGAGVSMQCRELEMVTEADCYDCSQMSDIQRRCRGR